MTVAEVIRDQIGNMALNMLGAYRLTSSNEGRTLTFWFRGNRKANTCRITLNGNDLYDVEILKLGRSKLRTVKTFADVHVENLHDVLEDGTGLYVRL